MLRGTIKLKIFVYERLIKEWKGHQFDSKMFGNHIAQKITIGNIWYIRKSYK